MERQIYLDFNASTPIAPEVLLAMQPYLAGDCFGNPSSVHRFGQLACLGITKARQQVAGLLGCESDEVIFTSGGSEANNHAIKGAFFARREQGNHIITTAIEHPAVRMPCEYLKRFGAEVTYLPIDGTGRVDPDSLRKAITKQTILISVMHANNEVGTIQPIEEISKIAKENQILFHSDAAQSVGKIPTHVQTLGVDLLSVAGHKFYAPKGIGVLYIKRGVAIDPLIHGAGHEQGRRAGTENTASIVALGAASDLFSSGREMSSVQKFRDLFWALLKDTFGKKVLRNGHPTLVLPNTLNVSFVGRIGEEILRKLKGVAASTGSACHSGETKMSPVLEAMGIPFEIGCGAIRFSLGRTTTEEEIRTVVKQMKEIA
ncbi:MAG: cysteine desulfurase NifS [Bdellovibrionales bacterium GWA2_49_15]|nr:MAG: cysteine desulfurase NifS [Bdellovibrionales bacterium GWA2_49_15]HAZ13890.1 cysteine desulfurase NifS [Bdellovibrionales bacterium]